MKKAMNTLYFLLYLLLYKARLRCATSVDQKCDNGLTMSVICWNQEPYVFNSADHQHEDEHEEQSVQTDSLSGLLETVLHQSLRQCCLRNITLNYTKISDGPASLDELLAMAEFDIIVPVGGQVGAMSVRSFPFVGIFESPGVAVLIKGNVSGAQLLLSVLQAWPILLFILISAALAGIVMWLMERKENAEQFPPSFTYGVFEGFWWAFITMTTVGYGDKAPKTAPGKLLGHVWMLAGLVIVTMFISIITTSLTSVSLHGRSNLRGVTVSAVNHSEEHKLAIREIATVEALPNSDEVFDAVIDRRVEGSLVDVHGLRHHVNALSKHNIQVANVLNNPVMYGAILASNSSHLQHCLTKYMATAEQALFQLLTENAVTPQEKISIAEDYFGSGGIFSVTVYSGLSLFAVLLVIGMAWEMYKKTRNKKQQTEDSADKGEHVETKDTARNQHLQAATNPFVVQNDECTDRIPGLSFTAHTYPTSTLLIGLQPADLLASKHSMEVMLMDQAFNNFRRSWEKKRSRVLKDYEKKQSEHTFNGTMPKF